ncbi:MAG: trypsin-like peptidase domain-containing protein [Chloroflexi bacterium]|nr:trypsin-like peptidase domain-containing protein [Chloroflexota bacterium]
MIKTRRLDLRRPALIGLAALTISALACSSGLFRSEPLPSAVVQPTRTAVTPALTYPAPSSTPAVLVSTLPPVVAQPGAEDTSLVALYRRVNPAVVFVLVESSGGESLGSGFVIDAAGHIVTNNHVVEGARRIEVDFPGGLKVYAKVIGADKDADIAVLHVDVPPEKLTVVELGDSDTVQVGQSVVAIGNPFGLAGTMTIGIVSGLGRTLSSERATTAGQPFSAPDIIQTDAAINPGNSGGPLLDLQGRVIGVNRAIDSATGVNSGVGFAVAVNTVKRILPHLIAEGRYTYPYIGIGSMDSISLAQQEALGLPQSTGVYVTSIVPGSPAEAASLRAGARRSSTGDVSPGGDLIIAIDGQPVIDFNDFLSYLVYHTEVGQTVRLTIIREGKTMDVNVKLAARP